MRNYDIAAYIWPAYTGDELRTRMFWPEGVGEWQSVKNAVKKYEGHDWPRKPLWGYVNEADPSVMEMEINEATSHGVNVFIYDWYWYDNRPFLENCLNDGFLKAPNCSKMKFYLMWANHNAKYTWDIRNSDDIDEIIWTGFQDRKTFEHICDRLIEKYFKQPNYYTIGGAPVFLIYDLNNLMKGLDGFENTKKALLWFRNRVKEAGFPDLHLQSIIMGEHKRNLSGVDDGRSIMTKELIPGLGFDSMTNYQFAQFTNIDRDYGEILKDVVTEWERIEKNYPIPFFPHVSVGWDNNPRFQNFKKGVVTGNTPDMVEKAFRMAKDYLDRHEEQPPLLTVNSWNEWTETSYLEPDDLYGYGYLDAIKRVFKD